MLEKLRIIFTIPDLRRKILLTLALLAVYRAGRISKQGFGFQCQPVDQRHDLWLGHHALHFCIDYFAADGHGLQTAGRPPKRRGGGA